jgi:hypothetical protein
MTGLKDFQKDLKGQYLVDVQILESFPSFFYYSLNVDYNITDQIYLGVSGNYGSTVGRIHYSDYSGEVLADQLVRYFSIGLPFAYLLNPDSKIICQIGAAGMFYFGRVNLRFKNRIGNQIESDEFPLKSTNLSVIPSFAVTRRSKHIGVSLQTSYNLDLFKGKLFFDDGNHLVSSSEAEVNTNFTGYRLSLILQYYFNFSKHLF